MTIIRIRENGFLSYLDLSSRFTNERRNATLDLMCSHAKRNAKNNVRDAMRAHAALGARSATSAQQKPESPKARRDITIDIAETMPPETQFETSPKTQDVRCAPKCPLRLMGGLACLALWLLALPRTLLVNSAGAYSHASLLAESFAAALVLCAIAPLFGSGARKRKKPTKKRAASDGQTSMEKSACAEECMDTGKLAEENARQAALRVTGCAAALSTICGIASLFIPQPVARAVLACIQLAAGAPLLSIWWRPLARIAQSSTRRALLVTCASFGMAAATHLLLDVGGIATGTATNLLEWTGILLTFFSFLPAMSWILGYRLFISPTNGASKRDAARNATEETDAAQGVNVDADDRNAGESRKQNGQNAKNETAKPLVLFATTAFTSLTVSLFGGFTFVAHQFNLTRASLLEHALLLATMALAIALATAKKANEPEGAKGSPNGRGKPNESGEPSERTGRKLPGKRISLDGQDSPNLLGIPSFCLVIAGMVALNVGMPLSAVVSHGLLQAATDCLLALGMLTLVTCLPLETPGSFKTNPTTWWCLGLLSLGSICGPCWGVALRRTLGLNASALTVAATICIALFAILYFTQVGLSLGRMLAKTTSATTPNGVGAASLSHDPNNVDAETAREIVARSYREALRTHGFSPREAEITSLLLEGYDAAAIADQLNVKLGTIRYHLTNAYRKADVASKAELVNFVKTELSPKEKSV